MADAYARQNDTSDEFALYESQLNELSAKTAGLPLTSAATAPPPAPRPGTVDFYVRVQDPDSVDSDEAAEQKLKSQPLAQLPARKSLPEATAYASVLDRYLGRLTATGQLPRALTVLRTQLDRNPNDPLLYERLATFFQQNNLSAQQEQIYQQAIAKFQEPSYCDKLARVYLRERKREAFGELTRKVTDIFSGTDLDTFFATVNPGQPVGPQLTRCSLNLYAAKRFPHDLVFTRNLLNAYQSPVTRDTAAYEALLRRQWWESDELRDEFLTYLSRTGKLQSELAQLESLNSQPSAPQSNSNPAARREQAEIDIFTSHFEQAAPLLGSVVDLYPAEPDTGDQAVSLYRSLAYLDPQPASTLRAVALEKNLLAAAPDSPDRRSPPSAICMPKPPAPAAKISSPPPPTGAAFPSCIPARRRASSPARPSSGTTSSSTTPSLKSRPRAAASTRPHSLDMRPARSKRIAATFRPLSPSTPTPSFTPSRFRATSTPLSA